jgi:hypothetical protein
MRRVRSLLGLAVASSLTAVGIVVAVPVNAVGVPTPNGAATSCAAATDPVVNLVKATNQASLLTPCPSTDPTFTQYSQTVNGVGWVG